MNDLTTPAAMLCHDLQILGREEDSLRRILVTHQRFIKAVDWTAMTHADGAHAARFGHALQQHLRNVGQAIDQRLFELVHLGEEGHGHAGHSPADHPRGDRSSMPE